jgi:hypothetical protein
MPAWDEDQSPQVRLTALSEIAHCDTGEAWRRTSSFEPTLMQLA